MQGYFSQTAAQRINVLSRLFFYYLGRMISSQKEVEFTKSDYDNLKAVRSIWICMDAGDNEDSIIRMNLTQENIFGNRMNLPNIDKVQGVIIRLRNNENSEESRNMLSSGGFTDEQICVATGKTMDYIIEFKKGIGKK